MLANLRFAIFIPFTLLIAGVVYAEEEVADPIEVKSAGCLLFKGEKVLVLEHEGGLYSFPGGRLEKEELPADAAKRETFEEIAIEVQVGELLYQFEDGYALFLCKPDHELEKGIQVPVSGKDEVKKVSFKKCKKLKKKSWRASDRFDQIKRVCKTHSVGQKVKKNDTATIVGKK